MPGNQHHEQPRRGNQQDRKSRQSINRSEQPGSPGRESKKHHERHNDGWSVDPEESFGSSDADGQDDVMHGSTMGRDGPDPAQLSTASTDGMANEPAADGDSSSPDEHHLDESLGARVKRASNRPPA